MVIKINYIEYCKVSSSINKKLYRVLQPCNGHKNKLYRVLQSQQ
jgi:hypothetical protein